MLLSVFGTKNHSLLRDLLAPSELTSKTVVELFDALQKHIEPETIIIAERFKLHKRTQSQNESVAQFVADLTVHVILRTTSMTTLEISLFWPPIHSNTKETVRHQRLDIS